MTEPAKPRMRDGLIKRGEWWYFVLDEPRDPATGRRRQKWVKGGRTRKEAEAARDDARDRSRNRGGWRAPTRTVLGDYLTGTWLPSIRAKVAPSTFTSYRQNLAHVAGRIGHVRLDALDAPTLDALYADLEARGLARSTVRLLHTQLHRALADAVRWDLLVRNPADLVDPPKPTRRVLTTWTADQLRTFLAGVAGDQLAALYQLAAASGMRIGELAALEWPDVHLDRQYLTVRRVRVTLDTYSHVTPGVQRDAVARVVSRFMDPAVSRRARRRPRRAGDGLVSRAEASNVTKCRSRGGTPRGGGGGGRRRPRARACRRARCRSRPG